METDTAVQACPRCHLRFPSEAELMDHLHREHAEPAPPPARPEGRVVLAVDPARPDPRVAVGIASALAGQLGAALDVVAATPPGLGDETTRRYLQERVRECRGDGAPWVGWHELGSAPPAAAIAAHTGSADDTWVCLGTRARTAIGEKVFGSVTEEVLRTSHVPVIVVGPRAGTTDVPFSRVVACTDRTPRAAVVARAAAHLADRLGARLVLAEVSIPTVEDKPLLDDSHLRSLADGLDGPADTVLLAGYREWEPVLELVQDDPTTVLVTGRRPPDAPGRFVAGSVATNLARRALGPVMVVPNPAEEG
jgi:nucleotide-binding universal stress UspA family protein